MVMASSDAGSSKRRRLNNSTVSTILEVSSTSPLDGCPNLRSQEGERTSRWKARTVWPQGQSLGCSTDYDAGIAADIGAEAKGANEKISPECCYGMITQIPIKPKTAILSTSSHIPLVFHRPCLLTQEGCAEVAFDIIPAESARVLCEMEAVAEIAVQLYCHSKLELPTGTKRTNTGRRRRQLSGTWVLNAIIYGPAELEEKIGEYLSTHQMYLQDPLGCDRCVLYRNPHILPSEVDEVIMTDRYYLMPILPEVERLDVGPDLLAQLMKDETPLLETEAPATITTSLFRHQKQALTFMLRREQGWAMSEDDEDLWTRKIDAVGRVSFQNNVTGASQNEPPPSFRGGLLADDMGLGKTLSMISLIASSTTNQTPPLLPKLSSPLEPLSHPTIKTTLLVVPPPLIQLWTREFQKHLQPGALNVHIYHGQNRKDIESLSKYDVVMTTFHTVSAIWRKLNTSHEKTPDSIFDLTWYRLVLDEAHTIRDMQSQLTQACYALSSQRRWAVTGTPIQNKMTDFASLLRFLRVYPFSNLQTFEKEILRPWTNGDQQGFLRLKSLVRKVTISRTKDIVHLPMRTDEVHHLQFSPAEQAVYDAAKTQAMTLLQDAISRKGSGNQTAWGYIALSTLVTLRLICNHGVLERSRGALSKLPVSNCNYTTDDSKLDGDCSQCGKSFLESFLEGPPTFALADPPRLDTPKSGLCRQCNLESASTNANNPVEGCEASAQNPKASMSAVVSSAEDSTAVETTTENMSTKIKALLADLLQHHSLEKSVVFSYWTYTLDLVQLMLLDVGISYTRIDGATSLAKRTEAVRAFQQDNSIRVILVSMSCGGQGLDLTAASRAYLMEPQWNPMSEEQALCRVHRVGQTRNVSTIRYMMRDSFEEQVMEIQKRKTMLAGITFRNGPLSEDGIGIGTLQYLKSVLE